MSTEVLDPEMEAIRKMNDAVDLLYQAKLLLVDRTSPDALEISRDVSRALAYCERVVKGEL